MSNKQFALVSLKSFGDMTIAARAIRMLHNEDAMNITLWIGEHHAELYRALQPNIKTNILNLRYSGVPAFYDVKDMGMKKAFLSFLDIQNVLKANKNKAEVLIFDSITWREKLLNIGTEIQGLDNRQQNIYRKYRETFLQLFGRVKDEKVIKGSGKTILIMPHGRKSFRNIPSDLIDSMAKICLENGFDPVLYMINGEMPIVCNIPQVINAERSFLDLRNAIEQSCAVISADSLASHLTTYLSKPVFVASPYTKTLYWLPPHSLENQFWGLFSESKNLMHELNRFLSFLD